ncbi:MAG: hypothetical protein R3E57_06320 [Porticoccaceae bacterium]
MKKFALAILVSGLWVNFSEFVRNEFLFKQYWLDKYMALGLEFPSDPINGVVWGLWGFLFAGCLVYLRARLRFIETLLLGWLMGFVLMWLVVGNMNVLPFGLLKYAVPWSLVEVGVAAYIAQKFIVEKK